MKTHRLLKYLCALTLFIGLSMTFVSCDDWDDDWDDDYDWDTFNDTRFEGYWVLTSANGQPVTDLDTNWLYFNGNGGGTYYYYSDGYEDSEPIRYNCQESVSGNTYYQINLQYGSGSPTTMNYFFNNRNVFTLTWMTSSGRIEYVYTRVDGVPW